MTLRTYQSADLEQIVRLFHDTVHAVCIRDYSKEQVDAWAPAAIDLQAWDSSLSAHNTLVAVEGDAIIGFADMDNTGYLDRLYVHLDHQRRGIATALYDRLEDECPADSLTTHASLTARPFFEQRGYRVVKTQEVERHSVRLTNFVMEKRKKSPPNML